MPSSQRSRQSLGRLALIPFGLLIALVALEILLQLGAAAVAMTRWEAPAAWASIDRRILALGDSNTYGAWLKSRERDAYPAQLQSLWNERGQGPAIEVLNMGYPGTNSSHLLRELPRMLEILEPDVAVVMIGTNDFWTAPVLFDQAENRWSLTGFLRKYSRVYRAYYMLARQLDTRELEMETVAHEAHTASEARARYGEHEFTVGWVGLNRKHEVAERELDRNLRLLVKRFASSPTRLVLMSYPGRFDSYRFANEKIREVALETGTPFIDLEARFADLCPERECPNWLFPDLHPRAPGYRLVAEALVEPIEQALTR